MEWWSKGVLECCRTAKMPGRRPALRRRERWKLGVRGPSEGGWRRVLVKNGCAQLHAFTQSSWALTLRTQTKRKSPQKGNGDWPQKNTENAKRGRKWSIGVAGEMVECGRR